MNVVIAALVSLSIASASAQITDRYAQMSNVPDAVANVLIHGPLAKQYILAFHLNPFYLRGDFDGDGRMDIAVVVKQRVTGQVGIAIIHSGSHKVIVLGAGVRAVGAGGDDFEWMDYWYVVPRRAVEKAVGYDKGRKSLGEGLLVGKSESASGLIFWNGTRYVWEQQDN